MISLGVAMTIVGTALVANDNLGKDLMVEQRAAYERIESLGGNVFFKQREGKNVILSIIFRGERFTDDELPLLEPFRNIADPRLGFVGARVSDEGIARTLKKFPGLKSITVFQMPCGDAAIAPLANGNSLVHVSLGDTKITAKGLRVLAGHSDLEFLDVADTNTDDSGLAHIEHLSKLKWLGLGKSAITSSGMQSIGKLSNLETLLLNATKVDDAGVKELAGLEMLHTLRLDGTMITNAGLAHLKKLPALKSLDLERTKVDNEGLKTLQAMPKLEEVRFEDSGITLVEAQRFHIYLPANAKRWEKIRGQLERGEVKLE